MRKPPLTSTAPVMEVILVPNLAQATDAMGAADVTGEESVKTWTLTTVPGFLFSREFTEEGEWEGESSAFM